MAERLSPLSGLCGKSDQLCCISANKIFDSARDKDCLEDVRVYLSDCAQEIIDRANAVRTKSVEVMFTNITVETVPFNKGYYQVTIRYYFCITLEACLCNGRAHEVKGLAAFDKKVILYGSEKNVSIFASDPCDGSNFCSDIKELRCETQCNMPTVVVEVASPIALDTKVVERCRPFGTCCLNSDSIPEKVCCCFEGSFRDDIGQNAVYVTIGMFSVIRMERPVQLVVSACSFAIPDKDSSPASTNTDPCSVFGKMAFPMQEFYPYADASNSREGCSRPDNR